MPILPHSVLQTIPQSVLDLHSRVLAGEGRAANADNKLFHFTLSEDDRIRWPLLAQATDVWLIYSTPKGGAHV